MPDRTISIPAASITLADGEHYAGLILNEDGTPSHHLVLLPGDHDDTTWQAAVDWAKEQGGELPTPRLLLAQAARLDIDADALRNPPPAPAKVQPKTAKPKAAKPVSTPPDAAHASDVSAPPAAPAEQPKAAKKPAAKKAKAKADPAPTTSANEAAAPPKATERPAWPFPTGARA